jgi:chaperonin GroES
MAKKKTQKKTAKKKASARKAAPARKADFSVSPLGDRVVVRPLSPEEMGSMTEYGIIIPDSAQEKPMKGEVVAVGSGKYENGSRVPMTVKAGDQVMFSKYGFDEVKIGGKEYYIISESNILGIIMS